VIAGYLVFAAACFTTQMLAASSWGDVLHPRLMVVGAAAVNMLANLGGFVAPYAWGAAKDATGGYRLGLMMLPVAYLVAAGLIVNLRRQLRARRATVEPMLAPATLDA
jgi:ACS family tartrate transporter-like MFS transporter